ncbi:MAG: hypothetical protein RBR74_08600 [Ignavibacteriaceae bacterium]|jgi:hypothetical protein|nr:hypothetical protein [Ignavibacteriaceae bacterium]
MNKISIRNGVFAFLLVLLLMPIGHSLMILNDELLADQKYIGAIVIGLIGIALLIWGIKIKSNPTTATILGFLGAILVWTGWVEFSFMWVAERENVENLVKGDTIITKREYLVMLSSLGILMTMTFYFLFTRTNCTFFIWFQKVFGFREDILTQTGYKKPNAVIVFGETIMILWFFYILLLVVYDDQIAGDRHWATLVVAFGSLLWSVYLIFRLLQIMSFDYAIRYAVPTVIIFWNFIEIIGRWGLFKEIWIHPLEYLFEVSLFVVFLVVILFILIKNPSFNRENKIAD